MQSTTPYLEECHAVYKWNRHPLKVKALQPKNTPQVDSQAMPLVVHNYKPKHCDSGSDIASQAKHLISRIDDPLWKRVCCEVEHTMGSFAVLKLWECELGVLSSQERTLHLYCRTAEAAQFVQQYTFVILERLQQYFQTIKEINIIYSNELK